MTDTRQSVTTGAVWEARYGYSRAVRLGDCAWVSGTTASSQGITPPATAAEQAETAFRYALDALVELGFTTSDVVRTRMYLVDAADADSVGAVHQRVLGDVRPTATMVIVASLVDPQLLVEIELDAAKGAES